MSEQTPKDLIPAGINDIMLTVVDTANSIVINDQGTYDMAALLAKDCGEKEKIINDYFDPKKKVARAGWQLWVDAQKSALEPPHAAKGIINGKLLAYEAGQRRVLAEKAAKIKAAAAKAAEVQKATLIMQGVDEVEAEEMIVKPEDIIIAPVIMTAGSTVDNWKWEMLNFTDYVTWCVNNNRLDLLDVNSKALNAEVKGRKDKCKIVGLLTVNQPFKRN